MFSKRATISIMIAYVGVSSCFAQLSDIISSLKSFSTDTTLGWRHVTEIFVNTSQTSFTNWASGGQNSFSINGLLSALISYSDSTNNWENNFEFGYGIMNRSDGFGFIKNDDRLQISSKYGYKIYKSWFFSSLVSLNTQINKGYYYPNDSTVVSRFLAPGYLVTALGLDYKAKEVFSAFISPITVKATLVLDEALADSGSFGVDPKEKYRAEIGGFIRATYRKDLTENVSFDLKLDLFSNYVKKPQNVDINWEMRLILKAYKLLTASLNAQLIYDDDIKIELDENKDGIIDHKGPRIQFRELFSIGITYTLD